MARKKYLLRLALFFVPYLFRAYLWFVFWTSRVESVGLDRFFEPADAGGISLGCCWHQDVLAAAGFFRGRTAVTMVSMSADGELISRAARRMGYVPVRGSSSRQGKEALSEMLEYMKTHDSFLTGLVTDGPRGPAFQSKIGIILMARESGLPLYPVRIWARRRWHASSWDQTMMPLPFNHIVAWAGEPLHVPPDAEGDELESYRAELDRRLNELVRISREKFP